MQTQGHSFHAGHLGHVVWTRTAITALMTVMKEAHGASGAMGDGAGERAWETKDALDRSSVLLDHRLVRKMKHVCAMLGTLMSHE